MTVPIAFKKLDAKDAGDLMAAVYKNKLTILFKFDASTVFRAKPIKEVAGGIMTVARPTQIAGDRDGQELTAHFGWERQVYFFKAKVQFKDDRLLLQMNDGIQKLIRRRDERYDVPADMPIEFFTKRIGSTLTFLKGKVIDISIRGIRIGFHSEIKFEIEDALAGELNFGDRKPIPIAGVVRAKIPQKKDGLFTTVLGMEIMDCEAPARLREWLTELHIASFKKTK